MESTTQEQEPIQLLEKLLSTELYDYILESSVLPRESSLLKELKAATASQPEYYYATAPDAGQLIALLLKMLNAKKTIEVGVYTGYSLLLTALTIPPDGKITAIDVDREKYEIGLPIIRKAGVEHKINFVESPALPFLDKLLEQEENEGSYDFAFVDADKENYKNYHEKLIKLIKVGGIIAYDNTLWGGTVAMAEENVAKDKREGRMFALEFNKKIADDPRLDHICLAPLGDGITICRRAF
ncbi:Caffeoyl-CoA O-methyltransferase [Euphorbia peplus]|nr:Caffeoyl-CoA O-methyltransferase [Euphorbia peplus]